MNYHTELSTFAEKDKTKWKEHSNKLVYAYNCTPNSVTGYSPFYLLFGREPCLPIESDREGEDMIQKQKQRSLVSGKETVREAGNSEVIVEPVDFDIQSEHERREVEDYKEHSRDASVVVK